MRAGELDRKIVIQNFTASADAFGERIETWATFATVWAKKIEQSGREFFSEEQNISQKSIIFKIRYLSGVGQNMRVSYDNKIYEIEYVKELGRTEGQELFCKVRDDA